MDFFEIIAALLSSNVFSFSGFPGKKCVDIFMSLLLLQDNRSSNAPNLASTDYFYQTKYTYFNKFRTINIITLGSGRREQGQGQR